MPDDTFPIEQDHQPEPGYEPPQLWEYGTLRIDTAGGHGRFNNDLVTNFS